jgi:hypothetical protein
MSGRSRGLGLVLLLAATSLGAQDFLVQAQACLDLGQARTGEALKDLAEQPACAGLLAQLESQRPAGFVEVPQTIEGLRDALAFHGEATRVAAGGIDKARVKGILAALEMERQRPSVSAWERFKRWLRKILRLDRDVRSGDPAWLRWLESIPPELLRALWWSAFGLMSLGLAWIVIRELREARAFTLWRPGRAVDPADRLAQLSNGAGPPLPLSEVARLPRPAQPAALLLATLANLRAARRLPEEEHLSNGELRRRLQADAQERELFGGIVGAAELQVYGRRLVAADRLDELIAAAARFEPAR